MKHKKGHYSQESTKKGMDHYEEEILYQSGISVLMKEHQNGLEFRILNVDMEELIAAAAKKKEDHLKGSNKKKNQGGRRVVN